MTQQLRDNAFALLSELSDHSVAPDALRIVSHSLLNLIDDTETDSLVSIGNALPWMAALVEIERGVELTAVSANLASRNALKVLTPMMVKRALSRAIVDGPRAASNELRHLAQMDAKLAQLSMMPPGHIRSELLSNVELLRLFCQLPADENPIRRRFLKIMSTAASNADAPLEVLAGLETSWNGGVISRTPGLADRSKRFEMSAVDHLRKNGYLVAVRAALAFGDANRRGGFSEQIHLVPEFRNDPALESLAVALCETRGKAFNILTGASSVAALTGWAEYLQGPCLELAESRDLSIREATSYAHFALHLVNICDLVGLHPKFATERVRRTLMDIEDDVKEFVLTLHKDDAQMRSLSQWDDVRWARLEDQARVADRLARLQGRWLGGVDSPPFGAAARLDEGLVADVMRFLRDLDESAPVSNVLDGVLKNCTIAGAGIFAALSLNESIALLTTSIVRARSVDGIDVDEHFTLDFAALNRWLTNQTQPAVLQHLLSEIPYVDVLNGAEMREGPVHLTVHPSENRMTVSFEPDERLKAVLTLIAADDTSPELRASLQEQVASELVPDTPEAHESLNA